MEQRINGAAVAPNGLKALLGVEQYLATGDLDSKLLNLVRLRASQINGCAYCIDMHWKDLRAQGETEQRLYALDAWRESPFYSARERAALEWTEAVTQIIPAHVPDSVYEQVRPHFDPKQLADLTLTIAMINAWNRLNIALRNPPGKYQPQAHPDG